MNEPLIAFGSFEKFKVISSNINVHRELTPYILEAQIVDLRKLLGQEFYYDLIKNKNQEQYIKLIYGTEYTLEGSVNPLLFYGIEAYLCYKTYARYVTGSNIKSTPSGMVKKVDPNSEPASKTELQLLSDQANSMAIVYEEDILRYLGHHKTSYPLWQTNYCGSNNKGGSRSRITAVG